MDLTDKPAPGKGFLLLLYVILGGSFVLLALKATTSGPGDLPAFLGAIAGMLILLLLSWIAFRGAYQTTYELHGDSFELRCGYIHKTIRLGRIKSITRTGNWSDLLNPFRARQGFCNRLTGFVRIELSGETVFLSPSNPDVFIAALEKYIAARERQPSSREQR